VPRRGLEPLLLAEPDPKSGASANFATSAYQIIRTYDTNAEPRRIVLHFLLHFYGLKRSAMARSLSSRRHTYTKVRDIRKRPVGPAIDAEFCRAVSPSPKCARAIRPRCGRPRWRRFSLRRRDGSRAGLEPIPALPRHR
jgi:hypothetical protein